MTQLFSAANYSYSDDPILAWKKDRVCIGIARKIVTAKRIL